MHLTKWQKRYAWCISAEGGRLWGSWWSVSVWPDCSTPVVCHIPEDWGFDSRCHCIFQSNLSSLSVALELTGPLTWMSTRNPPEGTGQSAHMADNLTAICEPTAQKMWEPQCLKLMSFHGVLQGYLYFIFYYYYLCYRCLLLWDSRLMDGRFLLQSQIQLMSTVVTHHYNSNGT
jgi:hypothetical protein